MNATEILARLRTCALNDEFLPTFLNGYGRIEKEELQEDTLWTRLSDADLEEALRLCAAKRVGTIFNFNVEKAIKVRLGAKKARKIFILAVECKTTLHYLTDDHLARLELDEALAFAGRLTPLSEEDGNLAPIYIGFLVALTSTMDEAFYNEVFVPVLVNVNACMKFLGVHGVLAKKHWLYQKLLANLKAEGYIIGTVKRVLFRDRMTERNVFIHCVIQEGVIYVMDKSQTRYRGRMDNPTPRPKEIVIFRPNRSRRITPNLRRITHFPTERVARQAPNIMTAFFTYLACAS